MPVITCEPFPVVQDVCLAESSKYKNDNVTFFSGAVMHSQFGLGQNLGYRVVLCLETHRDIK